MNGLDCPFRHNVHRNGHSESATCGLIQRLTGVDEVHCTVDRSACELCVRHSPFALPQQNPVFPSLLLSACESARATIPSHPVLDVLHTWAAQAVSADTLVAVPHEFACDIVLVCDSLDVDPSAAIDSALQQEGVFAILHLVIVGATGSSQLDLYATKPNVRVHRFPRRRGVWSCVQAVASRLETPFLAIQTPQAVSEPTRIKDALIVLTESGAEIFGAALLHAEAIARSRIVAAGEYQESLIPETLVMRRASFVDMGGFDTTREDAACEFCYRAACEGRRIEISDDVAATLAGKRRPVPTGPSPAYMAASGSLRSHATGFDCGPFCCDIVLPFRDNLPFVREALEGLLQQEDAEVVIHLVDDASREQVDAFLHEAAGNERVRAYRNRKNLGPFLTFNNISAFAETPYIGVQDADDISLPQRTAISCQLLQIAGADLVGARTELFGDPELVAEIARETVSDSRGQVAHFRGSRYPPRNCSGYFLENPTLVFRVDAFRRLGGYADFGESRRNRTGVDTEFQLRAHFARAAIAVTNDVLVRYRCHGGSATHHEASGFGSRAHGESHAEVRCRFQRFAAGSFHPRWFGALDLHAGVTERL